MSEMDDGSGVSANEEVRLALAENLARKYAADGGDVNHLFAAFVGVVFYCDKKVGADCMEAIDRFVSMGRGPEGRADLDGRT